MRKIKAKQAEAEWNFARGVNVVSGYIQGFRTASNYSVPGDSMRGDVCCFIQSATTLYEQRSNTD